MLLALVPLYFSILYQFTLLYEYTFPTPHHLKTILFVVFLTYIYIPTFLIIQ